MATPADQRLLELLEKWQSSLDLHLQYSSLDDDSYWKVQPWVEHQRPHRWIIDLARQRTAALKAQVEERVKAADATFSDAVEQAIFLANLVGSQHIERFIPLAESGAVQPAVMAESDASAGTATREMPKFVAAEAEKAAPSPARVVRSARDGVKQPGPKPKPARPKASDGERDQVIADAERLLQWGRRWFELPELIARMADRPSVAEVRRILKENKALLDKSGDDSPGTR